MMSPSLMSSSAAKLDIYLAPKMTLTQERNTSHPMTLERIMRLIHPQHGNPVGGWK
jgi:hypothetical protein